MGRAFNRSIGAAVDAEKARVRDLAKAPPPPGAEPLLLPGTEGGWGDPEFDRWFNASESDRRSGLWAAGLKSVNGRVVTGGLRVAREVAVLDSAPVTPAPTVSSSPGIPASDAPSSDGGARYTTRGAYEPTPLGGSSGELAADEGAAAATASSGGGGLSMTTVLVAAGVLVAVWWLARSYR